ncbi:MAG: LamG domain-containing protein [Actinomycetota bacterium]|nr:LamG domain-containing protein [Actinomycetota bacterium]
MGDTYVDDLVVNSAVPAPATGACQPSLPPPTDGYPGSVVVATSFESGTFDPFAVRTGGTGTATVPSTLAHTGGCAAYLHVTSDAGSLAYCTAAVPTGTRSVYADGWFNITTAGVSGNDVPYFRFFSGSTRIADIYRYNSNGQLWLRVTSPSGAFAYTRLVASSIPLSSWHHVVMHIVPNGSSTTIQVWFDGNQVYSSSQVSDIATSLTTVQLGAEHDRQMGDSYIDDVIIKGATS